MTRQSIIIIGAGPTGLALARSLAGIDIDVHLLDSQPWEALADPRPDGREIALTLRSQRILTDLGIWQGLPAHERSPLRSALVLNGPSQEQFRIEPVHGEDRLGHLVPNNVIRKALIEAIRDQANLTMRPATRARTITVHGDHVRVATEAGESIAGGMLVAADSRFSQTRQALGIGAHIHQLGKTMVIARLRHERSNDGVATEWFGHDQTLAMLPLAPHLCSAALTVPHAEASALAGFPPERFSYEIRRRNADRLGRMELASPIFSYPLVTTLARRFIAPRAVLLGDAAVGMHPVTAHGFNLGLRGQETLARLIAQATKINHDVGASRWLSQYDRLHRAACVPLFHATNLTVGLFTDDRPAARLARRATMAAAQRLPVGLRAISALLMERR